MAIRCRKSQVIRTESQWTAPQHSTFASSLIYTENWETQSLFLSNPTKQNETKRFQRERERVKRGWQEHVVWCRIPRLSNTTIARNNKTAHGPVPPRQHKPVRKPGPGSHFVSYSAWPQSRAVSSSVGPYSSLSWLPTCSSSGFLINGPASSGSAAQSLASLSSP